MRRSEKEIADRTALHAVIHQSLVCRLGLSDGYRPYIVPLCFGYEEGFLYFHAAHEGLKIELLRQNSCVCFEFDINAGIVENQEACGWSMRYQSVIGFGKADFLADLEEKRRALGIIMSQYSDRPFSFPEDSVARTTVIRVAIESMTGKRSGF